MSKLAESFLGFCFAGLASLGRRRLWWLRLGRLWWWRLVRLWRLAARAALEVGGVGVASNRREAGETPDSRGGIKAGEDKERTQRREQERFHFHIVLSKQANLICQNVLPLIRPPEAKPSN